MKGARAFAGVVGSGIMSVTLNRLRSAATLVCLVAILLPYLAGAGVARGLLDHAEASIRGGADLYVTGARFGRPAPVPLEAMEPIREIPGVRDVVPRIVGEIEIGADRLQAVVVGMPVHRLPESTRCVEGVLFGEGATHELVIGSELARRLGLGVGTRIPPFFRNPAGEHVSTIVGVFRSDLPIWEANLIFCSFETAAEMFDQQGCATSLLVTCEPGMRPEVKGAVLRMPALGSRDRHGALAPVVTSREDLAALLPRSLRHLDGIFQLHFVLAFAVGIPLLMVASGIGLTERRREAALLKATGWMTDEVLLRGTAESLVLSILGASISIVLAYLWLVLLNGWGIAGLFLPSAPVDPAFRVPFRLLPVPALLGFVVSFAIVATGTLYSTWRAATAPPALVLR